MKNPEDHDLTAPFELDGYWWRTGSEDAKVPGCLSYTPDFGIQLQLYGSFNESFREPSRRRSTEHPIWGEVSTAAGRVVPVSLFDDIATNRPNDPRAEDKPACHDIYYINRAIVGTHVLQPESLKFQLIELSIPDLESFVGHLGIRPASTPDDPMAFGASAHPLDPVLFTLDVNSAELSIVSKASERYGLDEPQYVLNYRYVIDFRPKVALPFDDCMTMIFKVANFLALCSREAVYPRRVRGVLDTGEQVAWFARRRQRKSRSTARDWMLSLKEIGRDRFALVMNNWFSLSDTLGLMGDVFFSELAAPSYINDARFFHFAGCLEAYHRDVVRRNAGKFIPKAEYKKVKNEIMAHVPSTLPEPLIAAMSAALSAANDYSFGERIEELFASLDAPTREMLAEDHGRFLSALKQSRNRMAHVSESDDSKAFRDREYAHANVVLRAWLVLLMLKHCGVPEAIMRSRMESTSYLIWGPFQFDARVP